MGFELTGPLSVLLLVLNVYAILQTAGSTAPAQLRALWVALILLLPAIGLVAWIVMGPRETRGMFR